ncbi:hypothetical protein Mal64_09510 [Pseudobythopirellula maris]|uniref:Copper resistance protein D n=1 Tax=Pseudobythopirellula maris TaxID=2527991 RepID=A0A5C5ZU63_9BACT|nr:hypothetical protein [Pseudobythopirellula maris]TWT90558.1 hypothetical protein Mal64_09510 [Pseudobythopirellula maris]
MTHGLLADVAYDGGFVLSLLSRVFHTTCAATILGGLVYLRFVLAPGAAVADDPEAAVYAGRRKAWAMCVGVCSMLLILSGVYNLVVIVGSEPKPSGLYHPLFGVKVILAVVVMALAARASGAAAVVSGKLKSQLNVALGCTLAVFVLGATLRIHRDAEVRDVDAPAEMSIRVGDGGIDINVDE